MSTQKLKNSKDIKQAFQQLFEKSTDEAIEDRAQMFSYIFLSEVQKKMEYLGINRKELAEKMDTTASYLTQLFRGNRMLNLKTIAKLEHVLDMDFNIHDKSLNYEKIKNLWRASFKERRETAPRLMQHNKNQSASSADYSEVEGNNSTEPESLAA